MYAKYHTEAIVLGGSPLGEADKVLVLYTHGFGLVRARATALRAEKSKMRHMLQNLSRAQVALVKGTGGWRLAGAVEMAGVQGASPDSLRSLARIFSLLMRLVKGEERNDYLYSALSEAHGALLHASCTAYATIELMCVARILYALGYLSFEAFETALFSHTAYASEHLSEAKHLREKLLASVNRAMGEMHL